MNIFSIVFLCDTFQVLQFLPTSLQKFWIQLPLFLYLNNYLYLLRQFICNQIVIVLFLLPCHCSSSSIDISSDLKKIIYDSHKVQSDLYPYHSKET